MRRRVWIGLFCAAVVSILSGQALGRGLLIRDALPWGGDTSKDTELTFQLGAGGYDVIASNAIGATNLGQYQFVITNDDQPNEFYDNLFSGPGGGLHPSLLSYVAGGGVLSLELCENGWNMGAWTDNGYTLPGGIGGVSSLSDNNGIVTPSHPIVTGIYGGAHGGVIVDAAPQADLDNWNYSSHGYFTGTQGVPGLTVILNDSGAPYGEPVFIDYPWEAGRIVASTTTTEWRYARGNTKLLANDIGYQIPEPATLSVLAAGVLVILRKRKGA